MSHPAPVRPPNVCWTRAADLGVCWFTSSSVVQSCLSNVDDVQNCGHSSAVAGVNPPGGGLVISEKKNLYMNGSVGGN